MAVKKKAASTKSAKAAPARRRKRVVELAPLVESGTAAEAAPILEAGSMADVAQATAAQPVIEARAAEEPAPAAEARPAVVKRGKASRYLLPGNMEIAALGPVHAELAALEAGNDGPFVLDGANMSVIDTAGLQLLISFLSAVKSSGKKVSWDNYSVQAYQLANELGLVDQLGD